MLERLQNIEQMIDQSKDTIDQFSDVDKGYVQLNAMTVKYAEASVLIQSLQQDS